MATLLDRIVKTNLAITDVTIGIHSFCGSVFGLVVKSDITRAEMISWFTIVPTEEESLDEILALPSGNNTSKALDCIRIWQVFMLCEDGVITKADAKTRLGLNIG